MKHSEKIESIAKALNKLQSSLGTVAKDSKGYNYLYADYASIWNVLREPLTENGLSILQDAVSSESGVSVVTRILHTSGEWFEFGPLLVPMGKRDAHSTGSAITYSRRYSLSAALGIVPDDDDGLKAQQAAPHMQQPPVPQVPSVDINAFKAKWGPQYPQLDEYLKARAKYKHHRVEKTIAECAQDPDIFVKNIETWIKKQKSLEQAEQS